MHYATFHVNTGTLTAGFDPTLGIMPRPEPTLDTMGGGYSLDVNGTVATLIHNKNGDDVVVHALNFSRYVDNTDLVLEVNRWARHHNDVRGTQIIIPLYPL